MEAAGPVIRSVTKSLLDVIKKHLNLLVSSSKHVRDMHARMRVLNDAAHDMRDRQVSNASNRQVVPHRVPDWLEEVDKIKARADTIPTAGVGCCNIKDKYEAGKQSCAILEEINRLMNEKDEIVWTDQIIPLSMVSPPRSSSSARVHEDGQNQNKNINKIKSRDLIFSKALEFLEPDNIKTQKMALCGMPGVGKTTMMEQLEKATRDKRMFNHIVKVAIGRNPNPVNVQQRVAELTGGPLTETTIDTRAESLKERLRARSEEGKMKFLVILDDVWEVFNLEHIGLASDLPNGFKLLLTSREEAACSQMGVEDSMIFRVKPLEEPEDKELFWETTRIAPDSEFRRDVHHIGEDIIKKCGGLPLAITAIASALGGNTEKDEWADALSRLHKNSSDDYKIKEIFKISYENLKDDDLKSIFLLSGLFPEDYYIGKEELLRYGWGLKFFRNEYTITEARRRLNTCVNKLIRSNLLIKSDQEGCVKMHDLVRDFVLSNFSKVKQASIVCHNSNIFELLKKDSYERILLKCNGMIEFPRDFNQPNLALLNLMDANKQHKFPAHFYTRMKKLEVLAYHNMNLSLLPKYSTNLRALCLHSCSLSDVDISFLGDLVNLEVLSLVDCEINKLPSKIGNLRRLKLLDLTKSCNLCIADGVFQNLEKLEELYMGVYNQNTISFTDANCDELKILSRKLSALELEFFQKDAQLINVSFENLKRFRISMGCMLDYKHSFKNTLKLVSSCSELLECKINELFQKTEILHLEVNDMSYLEDILMMHPPENSFCNLKELCISGCAGLTYLFTISVAKLLTKLESLEIRSCPVLKSVVDSGNREAMVITFHKLKILSLKNLPELISLWSPGNILQLPQLRELKLYGLPNIKSIFPHNKINISAEQPILNKDQVVIPKLEELSISYMKNLKEIWPSEITTTEEEVNKISSLRVIEVRDCDNLVNLFPSNPMQLLIHLEELGVWNCGSIEVLFNKDIGKINTLFRETEILHLEVNDMSSLEDILMTHPPQSSFSNLKELTISDCAGLTYLFTISVAKLLTKLESLEIRLCPVLKSMVNGGNSEAMVITFHKLKFLSLKNLPELISLWSPGNVVELPQLRELKLYGLPNIISIFPQNKINIFAEQPFLNKDQVVILKLEKLSVRDMKNLKEIWPSEITTIEEEVNKISSLRTIIVSNCENLVNLFPRNPMQLLIHLEELEVTRCGSIEVLFNIDIGKCKQHNNSNILRIIKVEKCESFREVWRIKDAKKNNSDLFICGFPGVEHISISSCKRFRSMVTPTTINFDMRALKVISIFGCGEYGERDNELVSNSRQINTMSKEEISIAFPSNQITNNFHQLRRINFDEFEGVEVVFEMESPGNNRDHLVTTQQQPPPLLPYLEHVELKYMDALSHVWKCSNWNEFFIHHKHQPQSSFQNLTTICLTSCKSIKYLFSPLMVKLLCNLKEIFISSCNGMEEVVLNKDDEYEEIRTSISFHTTTTLFPQLYLLKLSCMDNLKHIGGGFAMGTTNGRGKSKFSQVDFVSWSLCQYPKEINIYSCKSLTSVIPSYVSGHTQELHVLTIKDCISMTEVFDTKEINNKNTSDCGTTSIVIPRPRISTMHKLPNLKILTIANCERLEYIFTFSTLQSLKELEKLTVENCKAMKVIVREEYGKQTTEDDTRFRHLKSIEFARLPILEGFFLGLNIEFQWPLLDYVLIDNCPRMMAFTSGCSTAPRLKYMHTKLAKHDLECGLNFNMTSWLHQTPSRSADAISSPPTISEGRPWSYHSLIEIKLDEDYDLQKIIPSSELQQLQKLEIIHAEDCDELEEVFEVALGMTNNESQTVIEIPKLREINLKRMRTMKYIWKSNHSRILEFPNLTKLFIYRCDSLEHVFTCSMAGSLIQLQELHIQSCNNMKEVMKQEEEDFDAKSIEIKLPRLRSLKLNILSSLEGFCLGKQDFTLPSLDTPEIINCPSIKVFTQGLSVTPELTTVKTSFGIFNVNVNEDINTFITTKKQQGFHFGW